MTGMPGAARVGIVGCGVISRNYARGAAAFDSFDIVACADVDRSCAEKLGEEFELDVLSVEGLKKYFPIRRGLLRRVVGQVKAVDDVSFRIARGETLSLVGESGCGKTTTSRCILRAIQPSAGVIRFRTSDDRQVDVAGLPRSELRPAQSAGAIKSQSKQPCC